MIAGEEQDDRQGGDGASPVRRDRAPPAKRGKRQENIDVFPLIDSPYRISSASTTFMYTCLLRATMINSGTTVLRSTPASMPIQGASSGVMLAIAIAELSVSSDRGQ